MGISHSTARYAAPASFIIDFIAQSYGMLSKPNMADIHYDNLSFFSPQPYFIAGFFFPQQIAQVVWLYRLWKSEDPETMKVADVEAERKRDETSQMVDYVPFYCLGNVMIAAWMVAWNGGRLDVSNAFVTVNSLSQLYYICTRLGPMNTKSLVSVLTHVVSKTFAGIGVLDLLHNTSAAFFKDQAPSLMVKVLTGVGFGLGSMVSDWIFGGCLVYDLVALAVGQSGSWRNLLGFYAAGSAGIVAMKNLAK
jgi:hypothetical protein